MKIVLKQCPERKNRRALVAEAEKLASQIKVTEVLAKVKKSKPKGKHGSERE